MRKAVSLFHKGRKKNAEDRLRISIYMKKQWAERRDLRMEIAKKYAGTNHWNWQGGKSYEIYPLGWNRTYKEQIRRRDEYKCQMCFVPETELLEKLSVHHKDLNKNNIQSNNLITVCRSCHSKLHHNLEEVELE
jgi:5-methylcytosine-specific restriction endonuclease McrA